jgi:CMP-N-acetylneuraminic acid synthetase
MKIAAIVPMRHNSERVPGKNYRPFAGKPLYHYIIGNLLACPHISDVVIDTDSAVIMEDAAEYFPRVKIIERPEHIRGGMVSTNEVLLYDLKQVPADFYLQTHSTNPLLRAETISRAINSFLSNYPAYDSLFAVTRLQTRLWNQLGQAVNHNPAVLLRTQDLPPIYEENSNLYIFTAHTLEQRRNRIGERPFMFEVDRLEAMDIDEELDFQVAEFLYEVTRWAPERRVEAQPTMPGTGGHARTLQAIEGRTAMRQSPAAIPEDPSQKNIQAPGRNREA